jgi:hypothetical protein
MILDLWVKALPKFEDNVCPLEVSSSVNKLLEVVNVFVDSPPTLEESRCLQFSPQCLYFILRAEVCHELFYEFPPCFIRNQTHILVAPHVLIHKSCSMATLHEREGPHDLHVVICKLMGGEGYIEFTQI